MSDYASISTSFGNITQTLFETSGVVASFVSCLLLLICKGGGGGGGAQTLGVSNEKEKPMHFNPLKLLHSYNFLSKICYFCFLEYLQMLEHMENI